IQVFVQRDVDTTGLDRLHFIDALTGEDEAVEVNGTDYTLVGNGVLYRDAATQKAMLAQPGSQPRAHPFVQPTSNARRLDWVISGDRKKIAWTITEADATNALTTTTYVVNSDGSDRQRVLEDGPRDGIRVLPVAFGVDNTTLYLDYQPDAITTPFRQYAGVFALDIASGEQRMLPGEPGCFCAAAVGAGVFVRLELADDLTGFDVALHRLAAETDVVIPALRITGYTQAGDVLIAPDGTRALYTLAQVRDFGGPAQFVRKVFVLVNVVDGTQEALTDPMATFLEPVMWTEDNSSIILTSPFENGTWKMSTDDGRLTTIATATYLGALTQ
ncbi:MAG: hypothetical protein K8I30_10685, partial [Anaerolineae bacterium]|nr:hypothetical protein [Anaerolineae bacterium]